MGLGLGSWRFFLALLVAVSHLYADMIHGPAAYAVWGFFVLSGYLMTFVLSQRYGFEAAGLKRYAFNRFLRIYPSYVLASLAGLALLWWLGRQGINPSVLNPQFQFPQGWRNWLAAITMNPWLPTPGLPVTVAGALFVEVWAYALMPLFARSRSAAWLGLAVAFFANVQFGFSTDSFVPRYVGFATGLMPFAAGSLVCHYRDAWQRWAMPRLSVLVWCLHGAYWLRDPYWPWTHGLGLSVLLSAWVVLSLARGRTGLTDKWLGDLSYPLYLVHTTVGAVFLLRWGADRPLDFAAVSLLASLLVSAAFVWWIDRPLQKLKLPA